MTLRFAEIEFDWPEPCAEHEWQPVSFRFETQLLDRDGRVEIRQPSTEAGRVYVVCMKCLRHTYVETKWVGYYLGPNPIGEG